MKIKISELKSITDRIYSYLEQSDRTHFDISEDYYWIVSAAEKYNPSADPHVTEVGQLSEDWARLLSIADGRDPPIGYALVWLASILRIVGEKTIH